MAKILTINKLKRELEDTETSNAEIKAAARMVGFDMDTKTDDYLANADQRVRVNIYQRGRINTLKSLIEDLESED